MTIDLVRVSGVALERDSVRTTTDASGLFTIDVPALSTGEVVADVVVRPRSGPGYRALRWRVPATTRGGDALVLRPWSTVPHLPDIAQVYRRGGAEEALANAVVEFRPTGGAMVPGLAAGVFRTTTNESGTFPLFGDSVKPAEAGVVVGDLTIMLPTPPGPSVHLGYTLTASPEFRARALFRRIGAGPSLRYLIRVVIRASGVGARDVQVTFQRTGGVDLDPPTWTLATPGDGNIVFPARALAHGSLQGALTITPAAPFKSYVYQWNLTTFDGDSTPAGAVLGVGPWLPYYLIIRANGVPLKNARVEFTRTGGIAVQPSSFAAQTSDSGIVYMSPAPAGEGDVIADIRVTPPAPHAPFTVRSVRLPAIDADVPGGRVLLGDWDVTAPPAAPRVIP